MSSTKGLVSGAAAPVLAVCGFSGAGKTTLLELAIPRLVQRGLRVAVVKHDAHGFEVDRPGKDSDRLFRAGATVVLGSATQQFERRGTAALPLEAVLNRLSLDHDLILVEGHKDTALPKLWLQSPEQAETPAELSSILATFPWKTDRLAAFLEYLDRWLPECWQTRQLYGGLLLGGRSSRMGKPKQLLRFGGRTLGEIAAQALAKLGDAKRVALGSGALPLAMPQLPDPPGLAGPAAALIAAHRWVPAAGWIVAACDHPWLRAEHIAWLAAQRQPGRWAVIPRQSDGHYCPTLALYEPQALEALDRNPCADRESSVRPLVLLEMPQTFIVEPPAELAEGWKNVNTPEELRAEKQRLLNEHGVDHEGA